MEDNNSNNSSLDSSQRQQDFSKKVILQARITKLYRPRFDKTLVLVEWEYRPMLNITNRTLITQNPGFIFPIYPKPNVRQTGYVLLPS